MDNYQRVRDGLTGVKNEVRSMTIVVLGVGSFCRVPSLQWTKPSISVSPGDDDKVSKNKLESRKLYTFTLTALLPWLLSVHGDCRGHPLCTYHSTQDL